jgi:Ser/Thr protein kinase RdoA (MazF antagonist)
LRRALIVNLAAAVSTTNPPPADEVPYTELTPDRILDAVESLGYRCNGRLLALNSYENRVYQVGVEDAAPVIGKFYRPGRWSDDAILEEHGFAFELVEREIPVVAPLVFDGASLHRFGGFRFSLYPKRPGRTPELGDPDILRWLGRFIGRIHAVGATRRFRHRPRIDLESFGEQSAAFLLAGDFVPVDLRPAYESVVRDVLLKVRACYEAVGPVTSIRLHGDCHPGNILWSDEGPHFVDLDDCATGPAIQDLWMLIAGDRQTMASQLSAIAEGYNEFHALATVEVGLVEALRSLRMLHYSAWLGRRWADPAFPINFPWFGTQRYWQEQILGLREQLAAMDEAPLPLS